MLSVARGTNPVQAAEVPQGHIGDAHARASGKLLLAFAPASVRDPYLEGHKLKKLTPSTITSRRAPDRELATIREQGYSIDEEEFALGLCCLAVPFDAGNSPFVLALSTPRERFLEQRDAYLAAMQRIAELGVGRDGAG